MTYLLDTDICIYLLNGRYPQIDRRLTRCEPDAVMLSSIVVAELAYGAANSSNPQRNYNTLELFVSAFTVLPFGYREARSYGEIRAQLRRLGTPIGSADTFIAAHAHANDLILVTNNIRQFQHVSDLQLENWLESQE
ncbi:MAG: type II toxin-antitoxin system VapC family toxin [Anaerolineae bacterium]|nr:type II toxin-antitoxin system VapC family toxin [Anaerolineae bacterium]MCO5192202.1 type II toxin-antitoxin system VapC family toxin [Anaerolineae bacterium]MCO5198364.1 type II toxin-antitoxin system VapC family toxin [Anaerolineae bacterium]MCO5205771.1 type II toxin-antitoxin system VapC family toxin [Anaerolineae bacterium]